MRGPRLALLAVITVGAVCTGCNSRGPEPLSASAAAMFAPVSMRIHPIFTQVKDWTGDNKPDGVEALIELEDQFGDPTKAAGTVIFELYSYRQYHPDPRGDRLVNPWIGSLNTLADQKVRWNRTSRTYSFQLEYPQINTATNYVLTATFDTGTMRFFDKIVLESLAKEPQIVAPAPAPPIPATLPATFPTTAPTTFPATVPAATAPGAGIFELPRWRAPATGAASRPAATRP
jgi:hypothetical protein